MIINIDTYRCTKCKKFYDFDTSKEYNNICDKCNTSLTFIGNSNIDPDKKEKVPEMQPEQYFQYINSKPTITCPYCQSTNIKKISKTSRFVSTGLFGLASSKIGKQWHCNSCKSDF